MKGVLLGHDTSANSSSQRLGSVLLERADSPAHCSAGTQHSSGAESSVSEQSW